MGSFLLTVELFCLQLTILAFLLTVGAFLLTVLAFLLTVGAFFAYSGKVRLIRALRDCKQRSLTVSKKAPTVSKRASPLVFKENLSKGFPETGIGPWMALPRLVRISLPFFRNHYMFNLKTIKSCNCNWRKFLRIPEGNFSCNCILQEKQGNKETVSVLLIDSEDPWKL